jgi:hypothetical protein
MSGSIAIPFPDVPTIPGSETAARMKAWALKTLKKAKKWRPKKPKLPEFFAAKLLGSCALGFATGCSMNNEHPGVMLGVLFLTAPCIGLPVGECLRSGRYGGCLALLTAQYVGIEAGIALKAHYFGL